MENSGDERDSNPPTSDAESGSEVEDAGRDATAWARKFLLDDSSSAHLPSAFDAYFTQAGKSSKTSSNVFSQLVPPLTPEEFHERIRGMKVPALLNERISALEESHVNYFPMYLTELAVNFNLIFYGFGSKRKVLNRFARLCAKKGHVVIANAFFPNFALKDFLASAEQVIGAPDVPNAGSGLEAQCRRILEKYARKPTARHLFLIIHNIDAPALRSERAKSCLAALASHRSIHIAASVDHINAPLLWSTTESFAQPKARQSSGSENHSIAGQALPTGGFSWLWHDLTTMQSYDFELTYADRTSYAGTSVGQRGRGIQANIAGIGTAGGMIAEGAAKHVLASVTAKAKRLFALLCTRQTAAMDALAAETGSGAPVQPGPHVATSYELLFAAARDEFIATNDTAMQALLGEYRDHGLVVSSSAADGSGTLWIPLPKDALTRLASEIS
ncbi:origin recognition complex subunit 2 [Fomitiporia mediterranea MF3/22]|uniref:origin recognition complex subunit 2 n=1 Tax=Fomitiporia mediterranea (strain MF3/22) TaxID=694068 RepID=UPI00044073C9|nr:origin recognition complex subunit 2 [Fomitiporia mediterranea MF3/22]EJD07302.1 origin recognition complex subunit 2 [Fomitiporia mediterranea MF3/22]